MKILVNPQDHEKGSGTTAAVPWEKAKPMLDALFSIRPGERIWQLEVDENGITARILEKGLS